MYNMAVLYFDCSVVYTENIIRSMQTYYSMEEMPG